MDISKRNSALDITRITAFFCVVSIHFFLNSGFYYEPMFGKRMFVLTVIRGTFMICVPLFIMLTGYLMNKKNLSRNFYGGILKTLGIYLLASVAAIVYNVLFLHQELTADLYFWGILNYSTSNYSWYIEMYIGLFLLIPFINPSYNSLKSQKAKLALIITLICLTSLPSVINIYNFNVENWWKTPYLSVEYRKIIPGWWVMLYPLTYYFLGAYLREYPLKLKQFAKLLILIGCVIGFGTFNYYRSHYGFFAWSEYNDWKGLPTLIMSVLAFSFLTSIKTEKYPGKLKKLLLIVSDLCLGAYLVSSIFDSYFYAMLNKHEPIMTHRLEYFLLIVPIVFICSLALSYVLNLIYRGCEIGISTAYRKFVKLKTPNELRFETERLIIRPFCIKDAANVYAYASDPDVGPMAGWKPHESLSESRKAIRGYIKQGGYWAIELKETGLAIGSISLRPTVRMGFSHDLELGYVIAKTEWGKGLMTEAAAEIIAYAFRTGAETLLASRFDGNERSNRVIEKLGFKFAGHISESFKRFDGVVLGENFYLLNAEEYFRKAEKPSDLIVDSTEQTTIV